LLLSYEKDPRGLRDVSRSMQFVLIFSEDWYTCSWQLICFVRHCYLWNQFLACIKENVISIPESRQHVKVWSETTDCMIQLSPMLLWELETLMRWQLLRQPISCTGCLTVDDHDSK
jgi:hypothetical protein